MTEEEALALKPGDIVLWRDIVNEDSGSFVIGEVGGYDAENAVIALRPLTSRWDIYYISDLQALSSDNFTLDNSPDANRFADINSLQQALWLESDDGENEAVSGDGHIVLVRDFRASGDPAVILSKTMLAAPELLEMLDNVTASLETCVAHFLNAMPDADRVRRAELARQARTLVDRLMGREEDNTV